MNYSVLADFADMLAAAGVIASLLFVAFQVRQNTRAMHRQYYETTLNMLAESFPAPWMNGSRKSSTRANETSMP